jgi:hypothetical protein
MSGLEAALTMVAIVGGATFASLIMVYIVMRIMGDL